jgi:apolipoprotein N-acyltransferase
MEPLPHPVTRLIAHPRWCAAALGALAACGFQPLALWPLTLLALALLIELLARARSSREAAWIGWAFGVAHFALGNNWIATAFAYQGNMPAWLGWIAVVLLSGYLAVYPALATCGAWTLVARLRRGGSEGGQFPMPLLGLAFIPLWIVTEWLRAWVFTGFAWNPLGIVLLAGYDAQGIAFLAPWLGTYGLSGLVIALAAGLRHLAQALRAALPAQRIGIVAAAAPFAAILAGGMIAPASYLPPPQGGIAFTLVQPDVRQEVLNDPTRFETHFRKIALLSRPELPERRRLVLWPESGLPDYLRDGYPLSLPADHIRRRPGAGAGADRPGDRRAQPAADRRGRPAP